MAPRGQGRAWKAGQGGPGVRVGELAGGGIAVHLVGDHSRPLRTGATPAVRHQAVRLVVGTGEQTPHVLLLLLIMIGTPARDGCLLSVRWPRLTRPGEPPAVHPSLLHPRPVYGHPSCCQLRPSQQMVAFWASQGPVACTCQRVSAYLGRLRHRPGRRTGLDDYRSGDHGSRVRLHPPHPQPTRIRC